MVSIEGGNGGPLPPWMKELKGADQLKMVRKRIEASDDEEIDIEAEVQRALEDLPPAEAGRRVVIKKAIRLAPDAGDDADDADGPEEGTFDLRISLPADLDALAGRMDPLIPIYTVGRAVADLEEKLSELVRVARAAGKSWTDIGRALEISKQAAWERFSGED